MRRSLRFMRFYLNPDTSECSRNTQRRRFFYILTLTTGENNICLKSAADDLYDKGFRTSVADSFCSYVKWELL